MGSWGEIGPHRYRYIRRSMVALAVALVGFGIDVAGDQLSWRWLSLFGFAVVGAAVVWGFWLTAVEVWRAINSLVDVLVGGKRSK